MKPSEKIKEDVYNRWKMIGLLDGLEEKMARECAECFESMAKYLISESQDEKSNLPEDIETLIFPMIRRILKDIGSFEGTFDAVEMVKVYSENLDKIKEELKKRAKEQNLSLEKLDLQAEICARFSDWMEDFYKDKILKKNE